MNYKSGASLLIRLFLLCAVLLSVPAESIELDDVYRLSGKYRITTDDGLRVYFPDRCSEVMPRVMATLKGVKHRMMAQFPDQKGFEVSVLLIDHDDRESSSADPNFDTITLGLTEEIGALSTRGYSFEDRFALRLANIMILRTLGPAKTALRRRLGVLSMPPWFIEGLALYNAFPMDALHISRLYDMARNGRMYSMNDLSLINSRDDLVREEMSFQAHALMNFLHQRSKPDAGYHLLKRIAGNPARFDEMFREAFGMSLKEAFRAFHEQVRIQCEKHDCTGPIAGVSPGELGGGRFYQSLRSLPGNGGWVWVSSARRREEVYDLWHLDAGKPCARRNAKVLLKNVHPSLLVDPASGTIYIGKYIMNDLRQRRLALWAVPQKGNPVRVIEEQGSFRPLCLVDGRIWYLNIQNGRTRVKSAPVPEFSAHVKSSRAEQSRDEFVFPAYKRPLDVAIDMRRGSLLFIQQEGLNRQLLRVPLAAGAVDKSDGLRLATAPEVLHSTCGVMRYPSVVGDDTLFCAETQSRSLQLHRIVAGASAAVQLTWLPGGVWDYTFQENGKPIIITLQNSGFRPIIVDVETSSAPAWLETHISSDTASIALGLFGREHAEASQPVSLTGTHLPENILSTPYKSEYRSSYWLPKISRDDQGAVFGVYSYRADRLDRDRLEFSPTFGFKSQNWGYTGNYQHRIDLFKINAGTQDRVVRKSYLSNSYYERVRSQDLSLSYPFSLSTSVTVGANLIHRGIAEYPDRGEVPTVGRDHSLYTTLYHRAIRTEPFWGIFPRKGREVSASWRRGTAMMGGELMYDSLGIRWSEHIPLGQSGFVATLRGWAAEDDKENNIRRPDDLNLGGDDFLRGYEGSVRFGDSLRAASFHVAKPINLEFPWLQSWVHKEIIIGEAFWEMGDVRNSGRPFQYLFDHGFEIRGRGLLFRRIPVTMRTGVGWPHDGGKKHTYWTVDLSTLSGLIQ